MSFIHIILFTFVSEDLACITVGMLIHDGKMDLWTGILGCTTGIFIGDLGLWLIGRLSSMHMLKWSWLQKRLPEKRLERLSEWFDRRGWQMVLAARFLPGTRFPVYVGAGMLGRRALRFAVPALLAALIWTPTLVLLVVWLGSKIVDPLERYFGSGWVAIVVAIGLVFVALRFIESLTAELGREKWIARMSRCWRWEFWPMWLFYLPLVPWIAWLSLRHRGFTTITAANPGIPHSGIVGESKYDILKPISPVFAARTERVTARDAAERVRAAEDIMSRESWTFPVIVKPDAGQRGAGVRLARDHSALKAAMEEHDDAILLQEYHAGPFEAGIFYVRRPGAARGEI
ncbi:MAG: VTT domain-containing protein [Phycisphaerae bacterium]